MITVVVPVYNHINITDDFFRTITKNTVLPEQIILIDNASSDNYLELVDKYKTLNINYIKNEKNEGVNSAWNYGISLSKTPYISILNNDLLLSKYFFKMISEAMTSDNKLGIVVPTTIKNKEYVNNTQNESPKLLNLVKREGWAFTIRKEITSNINPIPEDLKIYFGDDYLFNFTKKLNYKIMKITNNFIFHYREKTIKTIISNTNEKLNQEKIFWRKIQAKEGI